MGWLFSVQDDVEPEPEEGSLEKGDDLQPLKKDGLDALPASDIIIEPQDLNPAKKPVDCIVLPKKKLGKFPLTIMVWSGTGLGVAK